MVTAASAVKTTTSRPSSSSFSHRRIPVWLRPPPSSSSSSPRSSSSSSSSSLEEKRRRATRRQQQRLWWFRSATPSFRRILLLMVGLAAATTTILGSRYADLRAAMIFETTTSSTMEDELGGSEALSSPRRDGGRSGAGSSSSSSAVDDVGGGVVVTDRRPWLVLHVGPPKTGTTTIQEGLSKIKESLAEEDNVYFLGAAMGYGGRARRRGANLPPKKTQKKNKASVNVLSMDVISRHKGVRDQLLWHLRSKQNAVISSEFFASRKIDFLKTYRSKFLLPDDRLDGSAVAPPPLTNSTSLRELEAVSEAHRRPADTDTDAVAVVNEGNHEPFFGYSVKIVVTYRHFFEWLPSLYYQACHHMGETDDPRPESGEERPGLVEFVERYLETFRGYDPDDPSTTERTTAEFSDEATGLGGIQTRRCEIVPLGSETSHGSVWTYLKWSSKSELHERVDVLDLHRQPLLHRDDDDEDDDGGGDLLSDFVCRSLPAAPKTCDRLRREALAEEDAEEASEAAADADVEPIEGGGDNKRRKGSRMRSSDHGWLSLPDATRIRARAQATVAAFDNNATNGNDGGKRRRLRLSDKDLRDELEAWFERRSRRGDGDGGEQRRDDAEPPVVVVDPTEHPYKRCLSREATDRLKTVSRNSLLQMALLTRSHVRSRNRTPAMEAYYRHLFRSSYADKENDDGRRRRRPRRLLLSPESPEESDSSNDVDDLNDDRKKWIGPALEAHDAAFAEFVAKGKLCEVDLDAVFDDPGFLQEVLLLLQQRQQRRMRVDG